MTRPWKYPRDRVVQHLSFETLDELCPDGGLADLVRDIYVPPSNETEAMVHRELLDRGYSALRKGWPDP